MQNVPLAPVYTVFYSLPTAGLPLTLRAYLCTNQRIHSKKAKQRGFLFGMRLCDDSCHAKGRGAEDGANAKWRDESKMANRP